MAITSYPFDDQDTTEAQFSAWARELQDSGVADSAGGNGFKVSADGSGMHVFIQPGFAIVRGLAVSSTAVETVDIEPASATARIDRVVLRLNPLDNSITPFVIKGVAGSGLPALTQTDTGTYDMPLAQVTVDGSATNIAAPKVADDRPFTGHRVGVWTTAQRPASPRKARLGLNSTTGAWEYWDGSAWTGLSPTVNWGSLQGIPATFTPAAHTHVVSFNDLQDKPTAYPPAAHTQDWTTLTGVPATFPPEGHSHSWASITSKPSSFPPASHQHNITTVDYANGSKRVAGHSPAGSGWFAVWCDGNDNFCHNTSSRRYKKNIDSYGVDPEKVLALRPVIYDRIDTVDDDGTVTEGAKNEYGLIAEEVNALLPELVVYSREGEVESLRYDLLSVALLDVVKDQSKRIAALEEAIKG